MNSLEPDRFLLLHHHNNRLFRPLVWRIVLLTVSLLLSVPRTNAQETSVVGDTLANVTISEDEAKNILQGLFDVTRLSHSLAIGKIARDEQLTSFTQGFVQRNNIEVLTIGYIDSDQFWPRVFREQRLGKIDKAQTDMLLAAKIIFMPDETDGTINGYKVTLELTGKTQQVYDLLQLSPALIDSIASQTSQQQLNTSFPTPSEAKETVVNALIAALQQVEAKSVPQDLAISVVAFQRDNDQKYGFDAPLHSALQAEYPATPIAGETVRASWKSLEANAQDHVMALDPAAQSLTFEHNGVPVTATAGENANSYKLTLTGAPDGTQGELLALAGDQTVGVLQTISYSKVYNSVKIVPVNGANLSFSDLQQRLDAIYAPAIAGWNVEVLPNQDLGMAWDTNNDGKLNDGETGMLSNYTDEMNSLIAEFRKRHDRSREAYYVFLVDEPSTPGKLGFMPRKKQWGFVFTNNHSNTDALVKTIAHELGHGVYRLEHPFAERGLPRGETDNLMDYANGTALYKYQWDFVHDPASVFTLFDEDEDVSLEDEEIFCMPFIKDQLQKIKESNTDGSETITIRWTEDMACDLFEVELSDTLSLARVTYDLPMSSFGREVSFNTLLYRKEVIEEYQGRKGYLVKYDFGDFEFEDSPMVMFTVVIDEYQAKDFERYLFPQESGDFVDIMMITNLIDENSKNTFSSFSIDNGALTGYFIERDGVPAEQERISGKKKRVPANSYEVVRNDCKKYYDDLGKTRRTNCANEFRLVTSPEKSGSRGGILIHKGVNFTSSEGCLITADTGYTSEEIEYYINGTIETITIYDTNGTSEITLNSIGDYLSKKEDDAKQRGKKVRFIIEINR